jgi:hypothetical protein
LKVILERIKKCLKLTAKNIQTFQYENTIL